MKNKNHLLRTSLHDLLPKDHIAYALLLKRANSIAIEKELEKKDEHYLGGVCVRLGENNTFAIPYTDIVEVIRSQFVTTLPKMSNNIAGVTNWRGKILSVIDLGNLFGIQQDGKNENAGIVIVSSNGNTVGILVNEIIGSEKYDPTLLESPLPMKGMVKPAYISGLFRGSIAILNLNAIMMDIQVMFNK